MLVVAGLRAPLHAAACKSTAIWPRFGQTPHDTGALAHRVLSSIGFRGGRNGGRLAPFATSVCTARLRPPVPAAMRAVPLPGRAFSGSDARRPREVQLSRPMLGTQLTVVAVAVTLWTAAAARGVAFASATAPRRSQQCDGVERTAASRRKLQAAEVHPGTSVRRSGR